MKSILLSVKPNEVCKILNGEQTLIVRKRFPKDYQGWVYIYCTKRKPYMYWDFYDPPFVSKEWFTSSSNMLFGKEQVNTNGPFNDKVVARFYCDKVEEINFEWLSNTFYDYTTKELTQNDLEIKSCLIDKELHKYLNEKNGYAIHISNLEVFDKPKELGEFKRRNDLSFYQWNAGFDIHSPITKAPQNYCYIEGGE